MKIKPRIKKVTIADGVSFYICFSSTEEDVGRYVYLGNGITPEAAYQEWCDDWYVMIDVNADFERNK